MSFGPRGAWPLQRYTDRSVVALQLAQQRVCTKNLRLAANQNLDTSARLLADWLFGYREISAGFQVTAGGTVVASTGGGTQTVTFPDLVTDPIKGVIVIVQDVVTGSGGSKRSSVGMTDGVNQYGICGYSKTGVSGTVTGHAGFLDAVIKIPQMATGSAYDAVGTVTFSGNVVSIVWSTTPAKAFPIHIIAFYGADLRCAVVQATPSTQNAGEVLIATPFRPDQLFSVATTGAYDSTLRANYQLYVGLGMDGNPTYSYNTLTTDGDATSRAHTVSRADGAMAWGLSESTIQPDTYLTRFDDNGFYVQTQTAGDPAVDIGPSLLTMAVYYGGKIMHSFVFQEPTSTGNQSYVGLGAYCGNGMLVGTRAAWPGTDTTAGASSFCLSAFGFQDLASNAQAASAAFWDKDAVTTTNTGSVAYNGIIYVPNDSGTLEAAGGSSSYTTDPDGLTFNWTSAPSIGTTKQFALHLFELDRIGVDVGGSFARPTMSVALEEDFSATVSASFPHPTMSVALEEDFIATVSGTFARPTMSVALEEDFVLTEDSTFPHPTAAVALEEDFVLTSAASFARPTMAVALEEDFVLSASGTFARPTMSVALEEDFVLSVTASFPHPTGSSTLEEDFVVSATASLPHPTMAVALEEDFILAVAGTFPHPTLEADLQSFTPSESDISCDATFQRPTAAAALEEDFVLAVAGRFPLPRLFWTNLTLGAPMDFSAGADARSDLGGGWDLVAELPAGYDGAAELEGSA